MSDDMEEIINEFITESEGHLEEIDSLFVEMEVKGYDKELLDKTFRGIHTIKGAAGFLGFKQIIDIAHRTETIMKCLRDGKMSITAGLMDVILESTGTLKRILFHIKLKDGIEEDSTGLLKELDAAMEPLAASGTEIQGAALEQAVEQAVAMAAGQKTAEEEAGISRPKPMPADVSPEPKKQAQPITKERDVVSTLRVDTARIDKLMDLAGEIVLVKNRYLNLTCKLDTRYPGDPTMEAILDTTGFFNRVTSELQLAVMKMRMQPIQKVFSKFPRMVRDLSRNIGKDTELEIFGEDTEVDKSVIEHIGDPLVHIIRNSIDHGIESPEERGKKGKPKKGKIIIRAYQKGTLIVIEVSDDGKGIDVGAVKKKAMSKGLILEEDASTMTDEAAVDLIFLPGFSTKEASTELSGRGVGMDVVKTNVAKLNGYVEVITKKDVGSTMRISLPLTLAIIQAMMVRIGDERYAIPQSLVEEGIKVKKDDIKGVAGQRVLTIRGRVLPLYEMSDFLGVCRKHVEDQHLSYVLIAAVGDRRFCLAVDTLLGKEEIVIKTIEGIDSESCGILGATITGDGRVVLILDLAVVAKGIFGMRSKTCSFDGTRNSATMPR